MHSPLYNHIHTCACVRVWMGVEWKKAELTSFSHKLYFHNTGIVVGVAGTLLTITVFLVGGILIVRKQCTDLG